MNSPDTWKAEIERRAAEVEAQKLRLRLAVLLLTDALRDGPERVTLPFPADAH